MLRITQQDRSSLTIEWDLRCEGKEMVINQVQHGQGMKTSLSSGWWTEQHRGGLLSWQELHQGRKGVDNHGSGFKRERNKKNWRQWVQTTFYQCLFKINLFFNWRIFLRSFTIKGSRDNGVVDGGRGRIRSIFCVLRWELQQHVNEMFQLGGENA